MNQKEQNKDPQELSRILLMFLAILIIFLAGFYVGRVDINKILVQGNNSGVSNRFSSNSNGTDVKLLWDVWDKIDNEYIKQDVDNEKLLRGAIKGLVASLDDQYTAYLDPQESETYYSLSRGEFQGIGTTLVEKDGLVVIETPLDMSPAQKAGLQPNDIILEVNGEDVTKQSVYDVAAKIRGDAGTTVALLVQKVKSDEVVKLDIVREVIDIDNILVTDLGEGIVKISVLRFTEDSVLEFNNLWDEKVEEALSYNPKGIVIDLRNNPGGFVNSVEYALGEFLEKGKVSFMEEDNKGRREVFKVDRKGLLLDMPMVVLVNRGSASASEIFAGAIADNERGQIIGESTVGKGVVQKLIEFDDGSILQLVFKKWLTPDGVSISKESPIQPDIEVEDGKEQQEKAIELLKEQLSK